MAKVLKLGYKNETIVSYLPLSHIIAQMVDVWVSLLQLGEVVFADKMALKSTLLDTLKEARPTTFVAVPRVWEKMWRDTRDRLAQEENRPFNRWRVDDPVCA